MLSPYPGGRPGISSSTTLTATPSGSTPGPSRRRTGCSTTWPWSSNPDASGRPAIANAVIPAAGLGTRFLPATKVLPKELLPVVDRPVIEWAVDEARSAGVTVVTVILSPGKDLLMRHFEPAPELEGYLVERNKPEQLEAVRQIGRGVR